MIFKLLFALAVGLFFYFKANQDMLVGIIITGLVFIILLKIFKNKKKKDYTPYWNR